jgi:SAM-dependent methyltransferase
MEFIHFGKNKIKYMITFSEFYKSIEPKSDKGTLHDYIDSYYSNEFTNKRLEKLSILEIGVRRGDSLNLLSKWFINSDIIGIDNGSEIHQSNVEFIKTLSNTKLFLENAYVDSTINKFENDSFDYIIDDGPHTLETQIISIEKWLKKIKPGGKLIIEDIQSIDDLNKLVLYANDTDMKWEVYDLRNNKGRYDDVLLFIEKIKI